MKFEINVCDQLILTNHRVNSIGNCDWGKMISIVNEHVQLSLLNHLGYDDVSIVQDKTYDLLLNQDIRIQSKLRQVHGQDAFSRGIVLDTTRPHSVKNFGNENNGHISYGSHEFDYLFISLIHSSIDKSDHNKWQYSLIPVTELIDKQKPDRLVCRVEPSLLKKYHIQDVLNLL